MIFSKREIEYVSYLNISKIREMLYSRETVALMSKLANLVDDRGCIRTVLSADVRGVMATVENGFELLRTTDDSRRHIEYLHHCDERSGEHRLVLRYDGGLFVFVSGTYLENEDYATEEYFRSSGSVEHFKKVEGKRGEPDAQEVIEPFAEFAKFLFDKECSSCGSQISSDKRRMTIKWRYNHPALQGCTVKMQSGELNFHQQFRP